MEKKTSSQKSKKTEKLEIVAEKNKPVKQKLKLYIDEQWYIPIDGDGYCNGTCYEGALGVVVQIKNDKGGVYALKVPRLLADTLKENAYICELLNEEKRNVSEIFTTEDEVSRDGLLRGSLLNDKIIQTPVESKNSSIKEAREQHGQLITVQFNKGRPPRFCSISLMNEEGRNIIKVFPEGVAGNEIPIKAGDELYDIEEMAKDSDTPWEKTIIMYDTKEPRKKTHFSDLSEFLLQDLSYDNIWYIVIPSIIYEWGTTTLTETIVSRKNKTWKLNEYLELINTIMNGLNALHNRRILHTDLRPANVMCVGTGDNPKHYKLIDYGSFNRHDFEITKKNAKNKDILGPTLSRERISPFYASERRNTIERENSDTVVFNGHVARNDCIAVLLGWRTDLIDEDDVNQEILDEMKNFKFPSMDPDNKKNYDHSLLIPGDKIQIRKYIFDIVDTGITKDGHRILLCNKNYWKIFHGKIITRCLEEIEDERWMSISRTIELRQWSYATDVYSIGAILFYILFWGGVKDGEKKVAETEFANMLNELNSIPFFKNMWMDTAPLCAQIEDFYDSDAEKSVIENFLFNPEEYLLLADSVKKEGTNNNKDKTFLEYAKYITFLITSSIKGTRKILKLLDFNYIYFIYLIHFGLCCIHRKSSLRIKPESDLEFEEGNTEIKFKHKKITYPFCADRVNDKKEQNNSIKSSLNYIDKFIKILNSNKYKDFILNDNERERNRPQYIPATELRRRFAELNDKQNLLKNELQLLITKSKELQTDNTKLGEELNHQNKNNKKMSEKYNTLQDKLNGLLNVNTSVREEYEQLMEHPKKAVVGGIDKEVIDAISQLIHKLKE